jgi:DNA-binding CsgD family transcriptional regulator/predicted negative regulator of RcsB-dependent stress response
VTRIVRVRVGRLGTEAAALARAVAILDDDAPLRHAAELAGLDLETASAAADALAGDEILLAREPLRFVHPLVRHAIANDIPASERAGRHLDAARLLHREGADAERVAAHLLLGRAQGDDWVVTQLCAAAREARRRSAPDSAARYLRRALEEPPDPERRAEVLADLGTAEALAGVPAAAEHLKLAIGATADPGRRAELALEHGRALVVLGRHEAAAEAYERGLRDLTQATREDAELRDQLHVGYVSSASLIPAMQGDVLARAKAMVEEMPGVPRTQGQRVVLAQAAVQTAFKGGKREEIIELAERAWDNGGLIEHAGVPWVGWRAAAGAFLLAGDLERSIEVAQAAAQDAQSRGWPLGLATARFMRGLPELWRGEVDRASAELEAALDARSHGWRQFARAAAAHYALCLIEKGELDRAEEVLRGAAGDGVDDLEDAFVGYSLGALRLEQGRPREALDHAISSGEIVEQNFYSFGYCPWRTAAAQALLVLGERAQALELAGEAAERAQRSGVFHLRIRALRVLGLCRGGREGIETLREAVAIGRSGMPRLETVRALVELGAALRRDNQRVASREPLQLAADLARRGGATALRERARTELTATGARPRRDALLSGPESLTPSERRIAELAAAGKANREIAQTLFVTPKTVEYHLRNAYRKLGIGQRKDLRDALMS